MRNTILSAIMAAAAVTGAAAAYDFAVPMGGTAEPQVDRAYYGCGEYRLDVETVRTDANAIVVVWIRDKTTVLAAHPSGQPGSVFVGQGYRWTVADDGSAVFSSVLPSGEASDMRLECKRIGAPGENGTPKWDDRNKA